MIEGPFQDWAIDGREGGNPTISQPPYQYFTDSDSC